MTIGSATMEGNSSFIPVEPLDAFQKSALSTTLPNWVVHGDELHRDLQFKSFVEAFGFMAQVALLAESEITIELEQCLQPRIDRSNHP